MNATIERIKYVGKNIKKPAKELPRLTLAVAGQVAKQQMANTKEYLSQAANHLKMLPKIRSFEDATHFATEAGNRSIAYAKKTLAVLKEGTTQYQNWAKKTAKTLGLKTGYKKPIKVTKKAVSPGHPKKRHVEDKQAAA